MVHSSNGRSKISSDRVRRRIDRRRVEILRAAASVFRERGFAAAGMREIALAADLSPGNLYHYFAGKDELLYFCQSRALDRLLEAAEEAHERRAPLTERLRSLATAHLLCVLDRVEGGAAHFEVDALPPRWRRAIIAKRDRYERRIRTLVSAGIDRGELAPTDAIVATRAFLGALNWTVQWYRPDGPDSPARIAALVADYAVAGLAAQPPAGAARNRRRTRQRRRIEP